MYELQRTNYNELQVAITNFAFSIYENQAEAPNIAVISEIQQEALELIIRKIVEKNTPIYSTKTT